jgi:membrane-bound lytic murein transglycosylase MltF
MKLNAALLSRQILVFLAFSLSLAIFPGANSIAQESPGKSFEVFQGDFEEILERRKIRALVVYNKLMFFLDGPRQRGAVADGLEVFRQFINKKYDLKSRKFNVIFLPVTRDKLIPYLVEGYGDIAVANLTIIPDRQEHVDFTIPTYPGVKEILITGPSAPEIGTLEDLSAKDIHVRNSSSYHSHLLELNEKFKQQGIAPVNLIHTDEYLEDSDLIEMVNAGLLPMVIVDSHKAAFWETVFDNITVRDDIAISEEGNIAWAFRKNSPTLEKVLNEFIKENRKGTLIGNTILNRYLKNNKWAKNALGDEELARYRSMAEYFQNYASEYDFDWLMLVALGFQESGLDQDVRSAAGAIGVMQVLQSTAEDPNVGIPEIQILEKNIHAGTKYLRFLRDRYFDDPGIDQLNQTLLSFASYNAGPAKIAKIRKQTAESGLDPNVWFGNVEHEVAKVVGRETVQYVSNIYKYYIAYTLIGNQRRGMQEAKQELKKELE